MLGFLTNKVITFAVGKAVTVATEKVTEQGVKLATKTLTQAVANPAPQKPLIIDPEKIHQLIEHAQTLKDDPRSEPLRTALLLQKAHQLNCPITRNVARVMLVKEPLAPEQLRQAFNSATPKPTTLSANTTPVQQRRRSRFSLENYLVLILMNRDVIPAQMMHDLSHVIEDLICGIDTNPQSETRAALRMLMYPLMYHVQADQVIKMFGMQVFNKPLAYLRPHLTVKQMTAASLLSSFASLYCANAMTETVTPLFNEAYSHCGPAVYLPLALGVYSYHHSADLLEAAHGFFGRMNGDDEETIENDKEARNNQRWFKSA